MTNELKPCPFCGVVPPLCESTFVEDQGTKWGRVQCECGAQGPEVRTGYEVWTKWCASAVEEWNRRSPPPIAGVTPSVEECVEAFYNADYQLNRCDATYCGRPFDCKPGISAVRDLCLSQAAERNGVVCAAERDVLAERAKQRIKWGDACPDWTLRLNLNERRDELVIAAALLIAEIERLDRAASRSTIAKEGN